MIDYVKLKLPCHPDQLRRILIGLGCKIYERGQNKKFAKVENLELHLYSDEAVLTGSLHKFYNRIRGRGDQNYNDFSRYDIIDCVTYLSRLLNVDIGQSVIQNVEYGLNAPIAASRVLPIIISYKGMEKTLDRSHKGGGRTIEFEKSEFYLKVYDKAAQHNLDEPLTRVEIKVRKGQYLKRRYGITTLAELLSLSVIFELKKDLLLRTEEILMADYPSESTCPEEEELYKDGFNPRYWANLKHDTAKKSHVFRRKWNEFRAYIAAKGLDKVQRILLRLIDEKWSDLMQEEPSYQAQKTFPVVHFLHLGKEEVIKWVKRITLGLGSFVVEMIGLVRVNSP